MSRGIINTIVVTHPILQLLFTAIIFLMTFIITAPLLGAIQKSDISTLHDMLRNIKPLYPFAKIILIIIEKITTFRIRKSVKK